MKLLYLYNFNPSLPGVNIKIINKIRCLNNLGIDITILCFTSQTVHSELSDFKVIYASVLGKVQLPKLFNLKYLNFITQIVNDYRANKYYKEQLSKIDFDLLVMRYNSSNYHFNNLVKVFKNKIVFEHNTIELEQFKLIYKGIINSNSWVSYTYFSEKYFAPKTLSNSAGIIGVTNEITNYEKRRVLHKNRLPLSITISNGINISEYPLHLPNRINSEINLVMILGVNAEWHGLERIIDGLNHYAGDKKITLFVIGIVKQIPCSRVVYLGYMNSSEINHFFESHSIHFGIASLSLHKINIKEASVLKAREYMARGIPFIYGYIDTDLESEPYLKDFFYQVDAIDEGIDINKMIEFYNNMSLVTDYPQKIRDFAFNKVDMSVKMKCYKDFLEDIMRVKIRLNSSNV